MVHDPKAGWKLSAPGFQEVSAKRGGNERIQALADFARQPGTHQLISERVVVQFWRRENGVNERLDVLGDCRVLSLLQQLGLDESGDIRFAKRTIIPQNP